MEENIVYQSTPTSDAELKVLTQQLQKDGCLKFGEFTLKSGSISKYYIDLRESTLSPTLFHFLVEAIKRLIPKERHHAYDNWPVASKSDKKVAIVGVPYGVVPLAGAVAYELKLSYFPVRKETKDYGNKQVSNSLCDHEFILIEDVMSTGSSIIETIKKLDGKKVTDVIVVVDRETGGVENIRAQYPQIRIHSVLRASDLLDLVKK